MTAMSSTASTFAGSAIATSSVRSETNDTGTAWYRLTAAGVTSLAASGSTL